MNRMCEKILSIHSLPLPAALSCGFHRRSMEFFSQPLTPLSAQGTSSEFEVVPTEEQNSPPESSGCTRNVMVSGWQVPVHIPCLLSVSVTWAWVRGTGPTQVPWAPWSHLGIHGGPEQGMLLTHTCKSLAGDFPYLGHTGACSL